MAVDEKGFLVITNALSWRGTTQQELGADRGLGLLVYFSVAFPCGMVLHSHRICPDLLPGTFPSRKHVSFSCTAYLFQALKYIQLLHLDGFQLHSELTGGR